MRTIEKPNCGVNLSDVSLHRPFKERKSFTNHSLHESGGSMNDHECNMEDGCGPLGGRPNDRSSRSFWDPREGPDLCVTALV